MPRVLVSLVTHNSSGDLSRLMPTLFAQTTRDFSIHATDNASEEGTRSTLAAYQRVSPVPFSLLASRENLGFTGGHNEGIDRAVAAGAEWVLVLNADLVLAPDFLERLLHDAHSPSHERAASFTGKILRATGDDLAPTDQLDTVGLRMTKNGRHFDVGAGTRDDGRYDRPAEIFGVSGCAALYRTAALVDTKISTGYFDDDFFIYREDVELAWRLRGRGWKARYVPGARAWHRRRSLPDRRGDMSPLANLHSVKNRFLLRINNAGSQHIRTTFLSSFPRDLLVLGGCLTLERTSLESLRWLAVNRERLLAKRREILSRRTVSDGDLLSWFGSDPDGARIPD
jgi:GT2 family glycosyltransferase